MFCFVELGHCFHKDLPRLSKIMAHILIHFQRCELWSSVSQVCILTWALYCNLSLNPCQASSGTIKSQTSTSQENFIPQKREKGCKCLHGKGWLLGDVEVWEQEDLLLAVPCIMLKPYRFIWLPSGSDGLLKQLLQSNTCHSEQKGITVWVELQNITK